MTGIKISRLFQAEVATFEAARLRPAVLMKFFVCAQMLMLGATRYFARGMELGLSRDLADRIFIITTVRTCPLQRIW